MLRSLGAIRLARTALCLLTINTSFTAIACLAGNFGCDSYGDFGACDPGNCDPGSCGCGSLIGDRWYLCEQDPCGWNFNGWINAGYIGNFDDPNSKFNGPYNAVDRANEPMMNQLYMIAENGLPHQGLGVGARVDVLYGEDFLLAQSLGMETRPDGSPRWNNQYYGTAIPQAYVSLGNRDLNIQTGHFYSIVGYEGVMAPTNFFYSKSYSYQFAGPFTHWGSQVNWNANESLTMQLGLVNGWNGLDRVSDSINVISKIRYDNHSTGAWTSFAIITGDDSNNPAGFPINNQFSNRTRYSWLVSLPLSCRVDYVFHQWLGAQEDGAPDNSGTTAYWYGLDQYFTLRLNDRWQAGLRGEWFRDEDGTRVGLNRSRNPNNPSFEGNFFSVTAGLNWQATSNLMIRPELRSDWYDGDATRLPYEDGNSDYQFMAGCDAILLF